MYQSKTQSRRPDFQELRSRPVARFVQSWWAPVLIACVSIFATYLTTSHMSTLAQQDRAAQAYGIKDLHIDYTDLKQLPLESGIHTFWKATTVCSALYPMST